MSSQNGCLTLSDKRGEGGGQAEIYKILSYVIKKWSLRVCPQMTSLENRVFRDFFPPPPLPPLFQLSLVVTFLEAIFSNLQIDFVQISLIYLLLLTTCKGQKKLKHVVFFDFFRLTWGFYPFSPPQGPLGYGNFVVTRCHIFAPPPSCDVIYGSRLRRHP